MRRGEGAPPYSYVRAVSKPFPVLRQLRILRRDEGIPPYIFALRQSVRFYLISINPSLTNSCTAPAMAMRPWA